MLKSGGILDTSTIAGPKIDKHSTGGIGDKVSLVLAPLAAYCGIAVPMIAGRGLGITGGTLDKIESIPGYRTQLAEHEFLNIVGACGCSITEQTERLVPADRKLYALRDVTGTVPSIPLIVASIMSKKLAGGIDGLVLDVKCGKGAFMKTECDARALGQALVSVGRQTGKETTALMSDMNQPLGRNVGNALEIVETVAALKGDGPDDLMELTLTLCAEMLRLAHFAESESKAETLLRSKIASGEVFARFRQMVQHYGGDPSVLENPARLPASALSKPVAAMRSFVVHEVDAEKIGKACLVLVAAEQRQRTA